MRRLLCQATGWLVFVIMPSIAVLIHLPESMRLWAGMLATASLSLAAKALFPWWRRMWRVE